jgi:hypothetical protein
MENGLESGGSLQLWSKMGRFSEGKSTVETVETISI